MKSEYSDIYNTKLKQMKEKILKSLIGREYTNGIKEILNLRNNYNMTITDDIKTNKALELLTSISDIDNINDLAQLEEGLNASDLKDFQEIIEPLKIDNIYKQAHIDYLTDFDSMDTEDLAKQDGIDISQIDGVNIYELKGIPFNFMTHDGKYDGNTSMGMDNVHTTMLNSEKNTTTIKNSRRILVFNNISAENINFMTTQDAFKESDDDDRRQESKMLPDEFFANMGKEDLHHYNDYQLNTQNGTLQPNAICIKGKITDKDIEYAKQRGISAIYSIDEECYKENSEKKQEQFNEMLSEYSKSFNPKMIAMLKNKNPYSREEFLNIIKTGIIEQKGKIDGKLLNANIDTLKRVFRRELIDANRVKSERGNELLERFADIESLRESDEKIINNGSAEEKYIKRYMEVERLKKAIKEKSAGKVQEEVESLLEKSDNFDKDITSILSFIEDNCNIEDGELYIRMVNACNWVNFEKNDKNPEMKRKIDELKSKINPEQLQDKGRISSEKSLDKIHSYFSEKSPSIDEIVSSISTIKEERGSIEHNNTERNDLLGSAIEATEETTRFDSINDQRNKIVQLQKERTQAIDNKNIGRE